MKIYTRTGDGGQTRLADGSRRLKCDPTIASLGALDELNAALGLIIARLEVDAPALLESGLLKRAQSLLFSFGAIIAGSPLATSWRQQEIIDLEKEIDRLTEGLPTLRNFILPGGSETAAHIHTARALCRRAERYVVGESGAAKYPELLAYLNRLSDYLFTLARAANVAEKRPEIIWINTS